MTDDILKIESVGKKYRLGMIGGTTLRDELQRKRAKRKGLEDPTLKVTDQKTENSGEEFWALSDINFTVSRGERVGIIGHNGAGKSTLLKLISRITAPTEGRIEMNGRIASMLEVGTGFHPELTGRENIYMNGAILGMNRSEIDKKIEEIIDFSECRQFIDTPVKRYSSGMYVKLAFSVAAHLDSEIMIMDEVLAVGDMAFQRKCLDKMNRVSVQENKTILYVSHNMNTIRQLCNRVIVLKKGQVIYDGEVEEGINIYMGRENSYSDFIDITDELHDIDYFRGPVIEQIKVNNKSGILEFGNDIGFSVRIHNRISQAYSFYIRITLKNYAGEVVTMGYSPQQYTLNADEFGNYEIKMNMSALVPGKYSYTFSLYEIGSANVFQNIDVLRDITSITIKAPVEFNQGIHWNTNWWGFCSAGELQVTEHKGMQR